MNNPNFTISNKASRYAFIQSLIKKREGGMMVADAAGIAEEKKLALVHNDESSILDEDADSPFVSPALLAQSKERKQRGNEEMEISKVELNLLSRELGRPISLFKVKEVQPSESEEPLKSEMLDYDGLMNWAALFAQ